MNGLMPRHQSVYRKKHSTETAMLRVWSDVLTSADVREVTLLGLLDLSAVFDCVNHDILLHGLAVACGLTNIALEWIRSFLTDHMQQVSYCNRLSLIQHVLFAPRVGARSTAVCTLHRRAGTRPTSTHVCRRLPGVPQHVCRRCSSGS